MQTEEPRVQSFSAPFAASASRASSPILMPYMLAASCFGSPYGHGKEKFVTTNAGEFFAANMTNTAWYDFGTGAGDDTQDDQQGEMPDTGAGSLAPGATIPAGNAAAGLTMLVGAGYPVLRRR